MKLGKVLIAILLGFAPLTTIVGCHWPGHSHQQTTPIEVTPPPPPTAPVKVPIAKASPKPTATPELNAVQVLWAIPQTPVEGYVIHYGSSKDKLTKEVALGEKEIERYKHSTKGLVYRYVLKDIDPSEKVFVGISAFSADGLSEMSDVFEVR